MKSFFWTETQHITIETGATALTVKTFNDNLASTVEKDSIKHKYVEMMRRKDGGRGVHNALICANYIHMVITVLTYIYIRSMPCTKMRNIMRQKTCFEVEWIYFHCSLPLVNDVIEPTNLPCV